MTYVAGTPSNDHSCIKDKRVTDTRVISYGYGDGGGGPQFEMIEASRRCADLNGCPKSEHKLVGEAMKEIERDAVEPDTYAGELYLELHRGTLTNQHVIKRNNRKAEFALRDLEIFTVNDAVKNNKTADSADIAPLYEKLLVNQFHDILPGTCIPRAHEESRAMTTALITRARDLVKELAQSDKEDCVTVTNTLSFDRSDVIVLDYSGKIVDGGYRQQVYTDVRGNKKLMVGGVTVPAFRASPSSLSTASPKKTACSASMITALRLRSRPSSLRITARFLPLSISAPTARSAAMDITLTPSSWRKISRPSGITGMLTPISR